MGRIRHVDRLECIYALSLIGRGCADRRRCRIADTVQWTHCRHFRHCRGAHPEKRRHGLAPCIYRWFDRGASQLATVCKSAGNQDRWQLFNDGARRPDRGHRHTLRFRLHQRAWSLRHFPPVSAFEGGDLAFHDDGLRYGLRHSARFSDSGLRGGLHGQYDCIGFGPDFRAGPDPCGNGESCLSSGFS